MSKINQNKVHKQIRNRLRLAKNLLEESDMLPGADAYGDFNEDQILPHERHERESVVLYLLLTCLDLLGQQEKHLTFENWIASKKEAHDAQRKEALSSNGSSSNPIDIVTKLLDYYKKTYGVTSSFNRGIGMLSEDAKNYLLSCIQISAAGDSGTEELQDAAQLERLKINFLFKLRNSFTHSLEQYQPSSAPMMTHFARPSSSGQDPKHRASWGYAIFPGGEIKPWGVNQKTIGSNTFIVEEIIIPLFEVLHATIGDDFDRSEININLFAFHVGSSNIIFEACIPNKEFDHYLSNLGLKRPKWKPSIAG